MEQETFFKKGRISLEKCEWETRNGICTRYVIWVNGGPTYGMSEESFETLEEAKAELLNYNLKLYGKTMTEEKLKELIKEI